MRNERNERNDRNVRNVRNERCPHSEAAVVRVCICEVTCRLQKVFAPLFFFPSCLFSGHSFLPVHNFP